MQTKDLVFPDWQHNLVNISASLAQFLGQPTTLPTLPVLDHALQHHYKNVVYLVVDAMGSQILEKNLPSNSFLRQHQVQTLTSVFPSTTVAATTTILSAKTPAQHGWFGWAVDFNGTVIELFLNRNLYTKEILPKPNFADQHLPYANFFDNVSGERQIYCLMPEQIAYHRQAPHYVTFRHPRDLFTKLNQICQNADPKFIYSYLSTLDSLMHDRGTTAPQTRRFLKKIDRWVQKFAQKNPDTLLVITADHGQVEMQGFVPIYQDQDVMQCLAHPISLESRAACFKIKPGMTAQFQQAFAKYQQDFVLYPTKTLVEQGVFGDFEHSQYQNLLGDFIAVGTATNKMLVFQAGMERRQHGFYRGNHIGPTAGEMYVPLILVNVKKELS